MSEAGDPPEFPAAALRAAVAAVFGCEYGELPEADQLAWTDTARLMLGAAWPHLQQLLQAPGRARRKSGPQAGVRHRAWRRCETCGRRGTNNFALREPGKPAAGWVCTHAAACTRRARDRREREAGRG